MKAEKQTVPFTPVILVLENQTEVDAIFSFLNHTRLADSAGLGDQWRALKPHCNEQKARHLNDVFNALLRGPVKGS